MIEVWMSGRRVSRLVRCNGKTQCQIDELSKRNGRYLSTSLTMESS